MTKIPACVEKPKNAHPDLEFTTNQLVQALPKKMRKTLHPNTVKSINSILNSPAKGEQFRENLLNYTAVLKDGKYKVESYINAVRFVGFKLMGYCNKDAYMRTFPTRYKKLVNKGASEKDISAYVSAYQNGKLVNLIYEQALIPSHILNADLFQKALNTQAELMQSARSEKVRSDAANSILNHLKRPESAKLELDINVTEDESLQALRESTLALVRQQREMLNKGALGIQDIAKSEIIVVAEPEVSQEAEYAD